MDKSNRKTIAEIDKLWKQFGNILIKKQDEIEQDFYCWNKGTYRFDIWHWFDEKLLNGLAIDFNLV